VRTLAVTENAKPVLELIGNVISDTYVEALQGVSSDEIGTMVKVLTRVHSNLSTTINADSAQSTYAPQFRPVDATVDAQGN
jgi:hypothetical protein